MTSPESRAIELERDLQMLDDEYRNKRERYTQAIQALRGTASIQSAKKQESHPKTEMLPQIEKESVGLRDAITRVQAIDKAIKEYPGPFTTVQLRDFIVSRQPGLAASLKGSYLPTLLTARGRRGVIRMVERGIEGGPNKWAKT
jgi:hypothetical protein